MQQATRYPQAPEYDVFVNVNAVARGWTNYYRYAHDNHVTGGRLASVVFWRTAHYLSQKHRQSIAKTMHGHYARDPATGHRCLFVYKPGRPTTPENRYFIWHKTPKRLIVGVPSATAVQDQQAYIDLRWAEGHSLSKRHATWAAAGGKCQSCGASGVELFVHHPHRLAKVVGVNKTAAHVAASDRAQQTKLLCRACHAEHHRNDARQAD